MTNDSCVYIVVLTAWSSAVECSRFDIRAVLHKKLQHRNLCHIVTDVTVWRIFYVFYVKNWWTATTVGVTWCGNSRCHPWKNWRPFLVITVCQFCNVSPIFPQQTNDLFCSSLSLFWISLLCQPLDDVIRDPFYLCNLVCPLFFVNLATFFYSGVTTGGPLPPVTPLRPAQLSLPRMYKTEHKR